MMLNRVALKSQYNNIKKPITEDLKVFDYEFELALRSDVNLINVISKYLLRKRGKRLRPILTLLASRICGEPSQYSYRSAAMIELLHLATLIHDDVVDDAELRRGMFTIKRVWKNKISVLMGDFILSKSLIYMIQLKNFDALEIISQTAEKLSAGEILQIEKSRAKTLNEDIYYEMISQKTASLFATCCELGALTSSGNPEDRKLMHDFGLNFGMAFQIKDDLFDLLGSESDTGKDIGADVKKNMVTLPLIYARKKWSKRINKQANKLLSQTKKTRKDLKNLQEWVSEAGGFEYARKKIHEFSEESITSLLKFPESSYKESLLSLVDYNIYRIK